MQANLDYSLHFVRFCHSQRVSPQVISLSLLNSDGFKVVEKRYFVTAAETTQSQIRTQHISSYLHLVLAFTPPLIDNSETFNHAHARYFIGFK